MDASRLRGQSIACVLAFLGSASALLIAVMTVGAQSGPGAAQNLRLVPFPKSVALEAGRFSFEKPLVFDISDGQGGMSAQLLNAELLRADLRAVRVGRLKSAFRSCA